MTRGKPLGKRLKEMTPDELKAYKKERYQIRKQNKAPGGGTTEVPVKVNVKADPLKLQVTIDPEALEEACLTVQKRIDELAAHFQVPKDEVNPFEALFLIADLQKEMLMELKGIHESLKMIQYHTVPTFVAQNAPPWGTRDPSLREDRGP